MAQIKRWIEIIYQFFKDLKNNKEEERVTHWVKVTKNAEVIHKFPEEIVGSLGIILKLENKKIQRKMSTLNEWDIITDIQKEKNFFSGWKVKVIQITFIFLSLFMMANLVRVVGMIAFAIFSIPNILKFGEDFVKATKLKKNRQPIEVKGLREALKEVDPNIKFWQYDEGKYNNMDIYIVLPLIFMIFGNNIVVTAIIVVLTMLISMFVGINWNYFLKIGYTKEEFQFAIAGDIEYRRALAVDVHNKNKYLSQIAIDYNEQYSNQPLPLSVPNVGQKKKKNRKSAIVIPISPEEIIEQLREDRQLVDTDWMTVQTNACKAWRKKRKLMERA